MTGGAHDPLRDEVAEALGRARFKGLGAMTEAEACNYMADAVLPVVRRFADAQVAAERERLAAFPKPNLSRLNEMDGYLGELARTTGDDGPLIFWREIRRSINAPIREHIERVRRGMQP